MSDIYERWFQNKDLHITEKHELNNEEYTKDISCTICYPVRYIGVNEEREFLKFWEMYLEIVSQIKETEEGLFLTPKLSKVKEKIENNCELQLYGYTLSEGEVNRRFGKFWT
ncbi:hypothetical protein GLOIN_2v1791382 [Rhizophagus clarus]|uniref:Uncharacterized protein n=1 Tax=Rhizophagus clarus TaxID=94130 RepID=A0A8H3LK16_9GLOM|nr:hypothetical protein GLOIN_2v1791382 [Rhizophagus clarus]